MKNLVILSVLSLAFIVLSCGDNARRDATTVGKDGWIFEGWACAPDTAAAMRGESPANYCRKVNKRNHDYLYLKFSAVASDRAIRSGRVAQMMSTCRDAALTQVKGDGISKILGDYLEQASGVSDGQSTGVAILRQSQGLIKGTGIYDCCAIDPQSAKCVKEGEPENWEQCMCVGYMRFSGGQKALETAAEKAEGGM
ncbi:MAG: lipoprotein LipL21 [Spirochaetia bacterium]|nr:lipoprotein LipL21 [Spirochaetia bacterium]